MLPTRVYFKPVPATPGILRFGSRMQRGAFLFAAAAVAGLGVTPRATAEIVATRGELDAILTDTVQLEDFEGVSVHGGTFLTVPNPLSSLTAPAYFDVLPGVTYFAPAADLSVYGGYYAGDASNFLTTSGEMLISFDEPQVAAGLALIHAATVEFRSGAQVLGTVAAPQASFAGWNHPVLGITSIKVTSTNQYDRAWIDDVEWGLNLAELCQGDVNGDRLVDLTDLSTLLAQFGTAAGATLADGDLDGDGDIDLDDLSLLLVRFGDECP